jgi:hypothetical protein
MKIRKRFMSFFNELNNKILLKSPWQNRTRVVDLHMDACPDLATEISVATW